MTQHWTKLEQLDSSQLSTYQGLFQRLKRAGVQHFLLDFGRVWAPGHQEQLLLLGRVGGALALVLVLEIVQTISKEAYYVDVCKTNMTG